MIDLTPQSVLESMERAVEDYGPDWIDPNADGDNCRYRFLKDGSTCKCLIGWVLDDLIGPDWYEDHYDQESGTPVQNLLDNLRGRKMIRFPQAVKEILSDAQMKQDRGYCWQDAYEAALDTAVEFEDPPLWTEYEE